MYFRELARQKSTGLWIIRYCALLFLFLSASTLSAGTTVTKRPHFIGGMFYHLGAATIRSADDSHRGLAIGLGGRLAFPLNRHIRIGGMGFSSKFTYESVPETEKSFVDLKAGGITVEFVFKPTDKFNFSLGLFGGGGSTSHLHIIEDVASIKTATYETYGTLIGSPLVVCQLLLTKSVSLAFMGTWVLGNTIVSGNSYGPCFHCGVLFMR